MRRCQSLWNRFRDKSWIFAAQNGIFLYQEVIKVRMVFAASASSFEPRPGGMMRVSQALSRQRRALRKPYTIQ